MRTAKPGSEQPAEHQALLSTATELLKAGQYDQVAELLRQAQATSEQHTDALTAQILDLACRICVACSQSQAEAQWHGQACQEAGQRERELKDQLGAVLNLIGSHLAPRDQEIPPSPYAADLATLEQDMPKSQERLSLRRRLQLLLVREPGKHFTAGEASGISLTAQPPPTEEVVEAALSPVQEDDIPTESPIQEIEASPTSETAQITSTSEIATREPEQLGVPTLVVHCLGPFRVYQDGQPIDDWPSSKGKAIFKYVVTHRQRPVAKEVLMELFWPEAFPDAARNNLNVAIYGLRQVLHKARPSFSHVLFEDDCYRLNPELKIWLDVEKFAECFAAAQVLQQRGELAAAIREYSAAEALYQGEFLEEDRYEDWPAPMRQDLQANFLHLLDRLSLHYLDQEDHAACATTCRTMLTVDPCCEEAHRRLMCCYSRQGQPYLALRQYYQCVETLTKELDATPSPTTTQLYERVRRREHI